MLNEKIKEIRIFEEKADKLELRELANQELRYTITVHGNIDDPEFIKKINDFKERIEKEVLKRV